MNIQERKNLTYRLLATLILIINVGMISFAFTTILLEEKNQLFLDVLI